MNFRAGLGLTTWVILAALPLSAQVTINLNSVIGPSGTNAADVDGVGNAVNFTGYALDTGVTTLIAVGSTGASAFNFSTGFSDTLDRSFGSTAGAGTSCAPCTTSWTPTCRPASWALPWPHSASAGSASQPWPRSWSRRSERSA